MNYIPPPKALPPGSIVDTYLRDSGGEGQDRSVDSQLVEVRAYFAKHKLKERRIYKDSKTAKNTVGRADFNRMLNDYQNEDVPDGLIIWDYARFARNARDAVFNIATIENKSVIVHSLTDNIPDGEYKELVRLVKHMGNQAEREKNSAAVKREMYQLVKTYKAMFGIPPRGIVREPLPPVRNDRTGELRTLHKWVPDQQLRHLVLRAFKMKVTNKTLEEINAATGLYKSVGCYAGFFSNKIYKGVLEFGDFVIEDYCEPIVPPNIWDAVNAMKKERKQGNGILDPRRSTSVYMLSGLIQCQECGRALVGHRIKQWEYYACSHRKLTRREGCHARHIPKQKIEEAVITAIREKALSLETLYHLQAKVTDELNRNIVDIERARIKLNDELATDKKKISNLTKAIAENGHSPSLLAALKETEDHHAQTQSEIKQLEKEISIPRKTIAQLKDISSALDHILANGTDEEKRNAIRAFTSRIIARRENNSITAMLYYTPIKIINPTEGLLGIGTVPPRGLWDEELISIEVPFKKVRS